MEKITTEEALKIIYWIRINLKETTKLSILGLYYSPQKGFFKPATETGPGGSYQNTEKLLTIVETIDTLKSVACESSIGLNYLKTIPANPVLFESESFEKWLKEIAYE